MLCYSGQDSASCMKNQSNRSAGQDRKAGDRASEKYSLRGAGSPWHEGSLQQTGEPHAYVHERACIGSSAHSR